MDLFDVQHEVKVELRQSVGPALGLSSNELSIIETEIKDVFYRLGTLASPKGWVIRPPHFDWRYDTTKLSASLTLSWLRWVDGIKVVIDYRKSGVHTWVSQIFSSALGGQVGARALVAVSDRVLTGDLDQAEAFNPSWDFTTFPATAITQTTSSGYNGSSPGTNIGSSAGYSGNINRGINIGNSAGTNSTSIPLPIGNNTGNIAPARPLSVSGNNCTRGADTDLDEAVSCSDPCVQKDKTADPLFVDALDWNLRYIQQLEGASLHASACMKARTLLRIVNRNRFPQPDLKEVSGLYDGKGVLSLDKGFYEPVIEASWHSDTKSIHVYCSRWGLDLSVIRCQLGAPFGRPKLRRLEEEGWFDKWLSPLLKSR